MPRKEYPKSRRMIMQAVMCLIFGGTVGLAAFVTHLNRSGGNARLGPVQTVGNVSARFPKGWEVKRRDIGATGLILFAATEHDINGKPGRKITIRKHVLETLESSEEFLGQSGLLRGTESFSDDSDSNTAEPITIAGQPGAMVRAKRPVFGIPFIHTQDQIVLFAASVRPSRQVISMEMACPEDSDLMRDQALLEDIAAVIEVDDAGK